MRSDAKPVEVEVDHRVLISSWGPYKVSTPGKPIDTTKFCETNDVINAINDRVVRAHVALPEVAAERQAGRKNSLFCTDRPVLRWGGSKAAKKGEIVLVSVAPPSHVDYDLEANHTDANNKSYDFGVDGPGQGQGRPCTRTNICQGQGVQGAPGAKGVNGVN